MMCTPKSIPSVEQVVVVPLDADYLTVVREELEKPDGYQASFVVVDGRNATDGEELLELLDQLVEDFTYNVDPKLIALTVSVLFAPLSMADSGIELGSSVPIIFTDESDLVELFIGFVEIRHAVGVLD